MTANAIRIVRLLTIFAVLVLWEAYTRLLATSSLAAAPSQVLEQVWSKVLADPRVTLALGVTLLELAVAFALAVVVGMLIGVLVGMSDIGRRSMYPVVLLLYGVPQAVLLPLFVLVFGLGPASKIAFGFTHGVFPVIVNTIAGMRNVNPLLLHGAAAMGAGRLQQLRYVVFPHMIAAVFTGLRLAMTMTLLGVLLAELFVSQGGIGFFTLQYAETFNPAALIALILTIALLAVVLNELVRLIEARFSRWKE